MSKITNIYNHLRERSFRSGEVRKVDLGHGARLAVRVQQTAEGGKQTTVTFARCGAKVGTTEEVTFRKHCEVPPTATRIPGDPTEQQVKLVDGETWHLVGYRWIE